MYLTTEQENEIQQGIDNNEKRPDIIEAWTVYNSLKSAGKPGGGAQIHLEQYLREVNKK